MKWIAGTALCVALSACAGVTFQEYDAGKGSWNKSDAGLEYYLPVPHLLVQRPLNKDGATVTSIVYLPDLSKRRSVKFRSGLGSGKMAVTIAGGMITGFNQDGDSKIPETLSSVATPYKGIAEAAANFATASLTRAEEDKLRDEMDTDVSAASLLNFAAGNPCDPANPIYNLPSPQNPTLSQRQAISVIQAANSMICAHEKLRNRVGWEDAAIEAAKTSERLAYVTTTLFNDERDRYATTTGIKGNIEAAALRIAIKPWMGKQIGTDSDAKAIEDHIGRAVDLVSGVADTIDPPKAPEKRPFELFRIQTYGNSTWLEPVDEMPGICAFDVPELDGYCGRPSKN